MHRQLGREVRSLEERREEGEGGCRGGGGAVELHAATKLALRSLCTYALRGQAAHSHAIEAMHSWGCPLLCCAGQMELANGVR